MEKMTVAVIMPCRNEAAHIQEAIETIQRQELDGLRLEILVADGGSTDGTWAVLQRLAGTDARLRVFHNPGGYVSGGLNLLIAATRAEIIIRMDAHTTYAPDYVKQCVATLLQTGADNVGGPARTQADGWMQRTIAAAYHSRFACGGARFHDTGYEGYVDTVTYGCWRRSTLERVGLFDEALIRNQDDELNLRILRRGGRIWQTPKIVSWYRPRKALGALFRQYFQYGYWKVAVIRKHGMPASWRHLAPGLFVISVAALAPAAIPTLWEESPTLSRFALAILVLILSTYVAATLVSATLLLRSFGLRVAALAPLVFATYHVAYGCGFLAGLWRFGRKGAAAAPTGAIFTESTR